MKRVSITPISKILSSYFDEVGIGERIREQQLLDNIESVMGTFICRYISKKYISDKTLYIYVSNSILRGDLTLNKAQLMEKLNRSVSESNNVIRDIIVK